MKRALVLALCLLGAGCFERPEPECAFFCDESGGCPEGYSCAPDGWCKRADLDPAFQCPNAPIDAAVDAAEGDASVGDADVPDAESGT